MVPAVTFMAALLRRTLVQNTNVHLQLSDQVLILPQTSFQTGKIAAKMTKGVLRFLSSNTAN